MYMSKKQNTSSKYMLWGLTHFITTVSAAGQPHQHQHHSGPQQHHPQQHHHLPAGAPAQQS
jgi:hypothetical protein